MSQFYDQASLVLVPSGYKNGKIYSQKPLSTDGELSFSRASNATRVVLDASGQQRLEKVRTNLIVQSQTFDNASWGKDTTTVTANAEVAPDGTLTADTMTISTDASRVTQAPTIGAGSFTASVYVKIISQTTAGDIRFLGVVDGSVVNVNFTPTNQWARYSATFTASTAITSFQLRGVSGGFVGTIAIWGFQLEASDFGPTDYIATTSAAVSVGPVSGLPRLDYSGGASCCSLLLEPQRTNAVAYNTSFDNAYFTKNYSSVSANVGIAPTGYQEADKIIPDTSTNTHGIYRSSQPITGGVYSVYAKADGYDWILLTSHITSAPEARGAYFNVRTGEVGAKPSGMTTWIEDAGNGWFRCSINEGNSPSSIMAVIVTPSDGTFSFTGDGTSGVQIWGLQNEQGAYPTSVILTEGASVTRVADSASKTGIASLIGQSEGTLYWEGYVTPADAYNSLMSVEVISTRFFNLRLKPDNKIEAATSGFSPEIVMASSFAATAGTYYKIAACYKSGDSVLYVNGQQVDSESQTFTNGALTEFRINVYNVFDDKKSIAQALLFKTRLSNADLATLTSL